MMLKNKSRAVHFSLDGASQWSYVPVISKGNQARLQENRPMSNFPPSFYNSDIYTSESAVYLMARDMIRANPNPASDRKPHIVQTRDGFQIEFCTPQWGARCGYKLVRAA